MDHHVDLADGDLSLGSHFLNAIEDRLFRRGIVRQDLGGENLGANLQRNVGEGSTDIDANSDGQAVADLLGHFSISSSFRLTLTGAEAGSRGLRSVFGNSFRPQYSASQAIYSMR
ncbi:hypothetical protein D9M68_779660 [compost metagenome]